MIRWLRRWLYKRQINRDLDALMGKPKPFDPSAADFEKWFSGIESRAAEDMSLEEYDAPREDGRQNLKVSMSREKRELMERIKKENEWQKGLEDY